MESVNQSAIQKLWARLVRQPAALGGAAILAVLAWQAVTVHFNYQGNYTALFRTGAQWELPPELAGGTYRFAGTPGYDGQFYRLVAHDPWLAASYARYADSPTVRWRRILVPAAAWLLAAGVARWIDFTYMLVLLLCYGLGVYALSRWLVLHGRNPAGGLLFLLLPGTLICIDRQTVDVALYTLLFLCLAWDEEGKDKALWLGLALCALTRDVGLLVIGAFVLAEASAYRFRRAAFLLTATLPVVTWYFWLRMTLVAMPGIRPPPLAVQWLFRHIGYGLFQRMLNPAHYNLPGVWNWVVVALDQFALAAMFAGVVLTFVFFRRRQADKLEWVGLLFAVLYFAVSNRAFWIDTYSWPRAFTPMFAALALGAAGTARRWLWLPTAAVVVRVGLEFGSQLLGVAQALR
ncbi:MAG TPA: hypothetical protein VGK29_03350 [Paludibaculum sp.]|jgi:hypothetical protein